MWNWFEKRYWREFDTRRWDRNRTSHVEANSAERSKSLSQNQWLFWASIMNFLKAWLNFQGTQTLKHRGHIHVPAEMFFLFSLMARAWSTVELIKQNKSYIRHGAWTSHNNTYVPAWGWQSGGGALWRHSSCSHPALSGPHAAGLSFHLVLVGAMVTPNSGYDATPQVI